MTSDTQRLTRDSATRRIHDELGLARLSPTWAKLEILLGVAAASTGLLIGVAAIVHAAGPMLWWSAAASIALQTLGGYLALAGNRSHLYQSQNLLLGWLANRVSRGPAYPLPANDDRQ